MPETTFQFFFENVFLHLLQNMTLPLPSYRAPLLSKRATPTFPNDTMESRGRFIGFFFQWRIPLTSHMVERKGASNYVLNATINLKEIHLLFLIAWERQ